MSFFVFVIARQFIVEAISRTTIRHFDRSPKGVVEKSVAFRPLQFARDSSTSFPLRLRSGLKTARNDARVDGQYLKQTHRKII